MSGKKFRSLVEEKNFNQAYLTSILFQLMAEEE